MKILIASSNQHKVREIREIFRIPGLELLSTADFRDLPEIIEDADTFAGNALKKSRTLCDATGICALGDDSGLEVDALGGAPGIHSARYAGTHGDDAANRAKLLADMKGRADRGAQFHCSVAISTPDGRDFTVEGICRGKLLDCERGAGGFGYDSMFVPEGFEGTFAEITPEEKNSVSHRGRALAAAESVIRSVLI